MKLAVVLASAGRADLLAEALTHCRAQQDAPFAGVISVPGPVDLPADASLYDGWTVITGVRGAAAQRNAGIEALPGDVDVVVFFDDDAVPRIDYLRIAIDYFTAHPDVVGLTGRVLLDGATASTGEIDRSTTAEALAASMSDVQQRLTHHTRELYGCNFAYRRSAAPDIRFDARLPLYSWLEDHDFARRLMRLGRLVKVDDCVVVHRAATSGGRQSHRRLGYSQFMNAVYLFDKGSFPLWLTVEQIGRVMGKNLVLSLMGPSTAWRRERLSGNLLAAFDAVRGRITPERILDL